MSSATDVTFGPCVFCGASIEETEIDPCSLTVTTQKDLWQVWYCHAECFKQTIVDSSDIDLSPAHF